MWRGGASVLAVAWLCAATAAADPAPRRLEVGGEVGGAVFVGSAYRGELRAFGQDGPIAGMQLALRALWGRADRPRLGVRLGYLMTRAGAADTLPDSALGARSVGDVWFHFFDVGAALRWMAYNPGAADRANAHFAFGFDVEAGLAIGLTHWVRGDGVRLLPRFALSTVFGPVRSGGLLPLFRVGAQYVPSGGAVADGWWDPGFAGVTFGLELGAR